MRPLAQSGAAVLAGAFGIAVWAGAAVTASNAAAEPGIVAQPQAREAGRLVARVGSWQSEPMKKRKGPPGFDLEFQFVGHRFDGTFGIEGVPQTVPEGEAFVALIKLTNVGKKDIKVATVRVTGDGISLNTVLLEKKVRPRTSVMVATFRIPAQSFAGSAFLVSVVLTNGDKHQATLSFAKPS